MSEPAVDANPSPLSSRARWSIGIGAILLIAPPFFHRGALIDELPRGFTALVAAIGIGIGIMLLILFNGALAKQPKRQAFSAVIALPILLALFGTYYLRVAVEAFAFHSSATSISTQPAMITGMTRRYANVRLEPGARELQMRVSGDLRASLDPYRAPGRDCILIDVEVGRRGWRRTKLPNILDDPIDSTRLVPCAVN